jgi:hypothetical protein
MKNVIALLSLVIMSSAAQANEYVVDCIGTKACTADYQPATCVYKKDLKASGSNKCQAIVKIEDALCAETGRDTITLNTKDFKCL